MADPAKQPPAITYKKKTFRILWQTELNGDRDYGEYDGRDIMLSMAQSDAVAEFSLFHENLHMISDMDGLNLTEAQVRGIEEGFRRLLGQNPLYRMPDPHKAL